LFEIVDLEPSLRGVLAEGVQFLSKPFSRDALAFKIGEALESRERTSMAFSTGGRR
jgi:hypothetical protein